MSLGKRKQRGTHGTSGAHGSRATVGPSEPANLRPERPLQLARDVRRGPDLRHNRTVTVRPGPLVAAALLLAVLAVAAVALNTGGSRSPAGAQLSPVSTVQGQDYHSLAVSPRDPDRVWFGSHDGIQESTDGGRTWRPLPAATGDAMSLAIPASDPSTAYMAGHDVFRRSTDGGVTWHDVQTDLPGSDLHGFAVDPADARHLYALVVDHGLYDSDDGGTSWWPLPAQAPGASGALAVAGGNPPTLYVLSSLGLMRSADGGKSWHRKALGLPEQSVRALLAVPGKPQEWYAAAADGLYHSSDGG